MTLNTGVVNNVWSFAGGYLDLTGLHKFGARHYDAAMGRWTQQDPIGGLAVTFASGLLASSATTNVE